MAGKLNAEPPHKIGNDTEMIFRLFIVLVILTLVISGGMYLYTNNPRYLKFAQQVLRYSVFAALVFALLYVLERYALVAWQVLV